MSFQVAKAVVHYIFTVDFCLARCEPSSTDVREPGSGIAHRAAMPGPSSYGEGCAIDTLLCTSNHRGGESNLEFRGRQSVPLSRRLPYLCKFASPWVVLILPI